MSLGNWLFNLMTIKKSKLKNKITKDMLLGNIAQQYPEVGEFLKEAYGLQCIGCFANVIDSFEAGMRVHGYKEKDITMALKLVNALL